MDTYTKMVMAVFLLAYPDPMDVVSLSHLLNIADPEARRPVQMQVLLLGDLALTLPILSRTLPRPSRICTFNNIRDITNNLLNTRPPSSMGQDLPTAHILLRLILPQRMDIILRPLKYPHSINNITILEKRT